MIAYILFLKEMTLGLIKNSGRIWALGVFQYKLSNRGYALGYLWKLLSPIMQIGVYWLVFGVGLRSGAPVDGVPYVVWLTCGLTPWYIMNGCVGQGASAIYGKASMLTRSNVPMYIMPPSTILAYFLDGLWTLGILIAVFLGNGCFFTWTGLGILYYTLAGFFFLVALSSITSVFVMLARDFSKVIQMIMRLVFFLSPIFWRPGNNMPGWFLLIFQHNPFGYVITGYRNCLLYNQPFYQDLKGMMVFWFLVLVLYLLGACCQMKIKKNLLDYL